MGWVSVSFGVCTSYCTQVRYPVEKTGIGYRVSGIRKKRAYHTLCNNYSELLFIPGDG